MITNDRQYRITKSKAQKFRSALAALANDPEPRAGIHPRLVQAEREAIQSQLADLIVEIEEYEDLKSARLSTLAVETFDELPDALIKARIARGLSQKALAERLGLKEQQIQRYEADRYRSASYQRLCEIADALEIRIRNDVLLPKSAGTFDELLAKLQQVGLEREFVVGKLLPFEDAIGTLEGDTDQVLTAQAGATLEQVFGWKPNELFGPRPLTPPRFAAAEARFKMPARSLKRTTTLYAAYANYLAVVVLNGSKSLPMQRIPTDPEEMRELLKSRNRLGDLAGALHTAWDLGVPVLPLKDQGTFHGACWRYEGRNVVVLKQRTNSPARWLFDLLHELFHAGQQPNTDFLEVLEADEASLERRQSDEEVAASRFAGEVVLDGKAEDLAQECVRAARNSVEALKRVVPVVAQHRGVDAGSLANYLAYRLSWQDINWWGAASNLQRHDQNPWKVARDVFIERFPFNIERDFDRTILNRALR